MAQPEISANDLRVFDQLKASLDAFDMGLSDIRALINEVTSCLDNFRDIPPTFIEQMRAVWWPIQYSLALSVDQERELDRGEERDVNDAVAVLQGHLVEAGMA